MALSQRPNAWEFPDERRCAANFPGQQHDLLVDTRDMIGPFLRDTIFCRGLIGLSFLRAFPAFSG